MLNSKEEPVKEKPKRNVTKKNKSLEDLTPEEKSKLSELTKDELLAQVQAPTIKNPQRKKFKISNVEFENWLKLVDPQLVDAYSDQKDWQTKERKKIVDNHFDYPLDKPLQATVETYKKMLRKEQRPEIVLHETIDLSPFERIKFYKNKLSSRGKFLAT